MSATDSLAISVQQQSLSPLELAQMLIMGDEATDIYWLRLSGVDFASLMRKGYALDLGQSEALREQHAKLYPFVQQAVSSGQGIYALPMSAYATVLLGEKDVVFDSAMGPTLHTLEDWMDYLDAWPADRRPDMLPFMGYDVRSFAYQLALQVYADSAVAAGQALSFDTELMRQIFSRLDSLAFAHGQAEGGAEDSYQMPAVFSNEWLFHLNAFNGDGRDSHTFFPFLLSASQGQPAALPMEVSCVFINARTKQPQAALRFLEALAQAIPDDDRIMLRQQDNQPVGNPHYPQIMADYEALLARQRDKLQQAEGAEYHELAAWLARAESHAQQMKEDLRYTISGDNIAAYRVLARHGFVRQFDAQYQGLQAAMDILPQYVDGSMDLERFIADIESRLRLIRAEHQ